MILKVSIRLSQILNHAFLNINGIQWNFKWRILSIIIYLIVPYYLDNWISSRSNKFIDTEPHIWVLFIRYKLTLLGGAVVIHNTSVNCMSPFRRWSIQVSDLSYMYGRLLTYHGFNGWQIISVWFCRGILRGGYHVQGR